MADLEVKRHIGLAMEFSKELFVVLKVETLDETKVILKFMVEKQNMYVSLSDESKSLKKLLDKAEVDKVELKKNIANAE